MRPPDDVEPSELFRKLCESPRPSDVIDFPRRDINGRSLAKIRVQVVDVDQNDEARIKAHRWAKERKHLAGEDLRGETISEVLGDRVARELLAMACVSVEPIPGSDQRKTGEVYARVFRSADDLRVLYDDELRYLWTAQRLVQRRFGPYEGNLESEEDVTAWMKRLTEGASALPLAALDSHQLAELTTSLAERAYSLSALLDCQLSALPDTLAARLKAWAIGTGSYGVLPASATAIGLGRDDLGLSPEPPALGDYERVMPDRPLTHDEIQRMKTALFGS